MILGELLGGGLVEHPGEVLGELLGEVLPRGGVSHPEKPVCGSLVQLRLTLHRSQAQEVEITRPGLDLILGTGRSKDDPVCTNFCSLVR